MIKQKFEDVDIVSTLNQIVKTNTERYQSHFDDDIIALSYSTMINASLREKMICISEYDGIHLLPELDVFLHNSPANNILQFYNNQNKQNILAYAVESKKFVDGEPKGDIYELDYKEYCRHVEQKSVSIGERYFHFENGSIKVDMSEPIPINGHSELGKYIGCSNLPEHKQFFDEIIKNEASEYDNAPQGDIEKHIAELENPLLATDEQKKLLEQPTLTVIWSESNDLTDGEIMSFYKGNNLIKHLDETYERKGYYDKTKFRIDFVYEGEQGSYEGRYDIGDHDGDIINHIKELHEFYQNDPEYQERLARQGKEILEEHNANYRFILNEFVPYLKLHNELSAMEEAALSGLNDKETSENYKAYFKAICSYVKESRNELNNSTGELNLPTAPKKEDFNIAETAENNGVEEKTDRTEPTVNVRYYPINEATAKHAKEMNSYSDYKPNSATESYRAMVDEAADIALRQKKRVDPQYHDKIDGLLDTYARKLADNLNHYYSIEGRVPSILIAGGSNFPVRAKQKQNNARDSNYREYNEIQGLLDKIQSTGMGGISADDPNAIERLQQKLEQQEQLQQTMKDVNAYYRKHKTLDGCPALTPEQIEKAKADMGKDWRLEDKPFPTWALSNNNAEIRRLKGRIAELKRREEFDFKGWEFDGGTVEANKDDNRLQIFFDEKPDEEIRKNLSKNGFRWSPKTGAWQRQLNNNAYYAAGYVKAIAPKDGTRPYDLLKPEKTTDEKKPSILEQLETNSQESAANEAQQEIKKHTLTADEKEIKDAVMDKLKERIAYSNDGTLSTYRASNHSQIVMTRYNVKIENNTVTRDNKPLFTIQRRYSSRKTKGCYRELNPTLEYVQEKASITTQLAENKDKSEQRTQKTTKKEDISL